MRRYDGTLSALAGVMRAMTLLGFLFAFGCTEDPCPATPTPFFDIKLTVTRAGGGPVDGVQASLSSATTTLSMHCSSDALATYCTPDAGGAPGPYTLHVTAPGAEPLTVDATVVFTEQRCGASATLNPSAVILNPE